MFKNLSNTFICLSRTFKILLRSDYFLNGNSLAMLKSCQTHLGPNIYLRLRNWLLGCFRQLLLRTRVVPEVLFTANEENRQILAEVKNLRNPLLKLEIYLLGISLTFSCTLSSESGESIAKQIKITCESGYERGRKRS